MQVENDLLHNRQNDESYYAKNRIERKPKLSTSEVLMI